MIYKKGDWPALAALVAPDYLGAGPSFHWDIELLEREFPKIRLMDFRRETSTVKSLGPSIVLLNEDGVMSETYAGQDISGRYRYTTIWVKRDGQ